LTKQEVLVKSHLLQDAVFLYKPSDQTSESIVTTEIDLEMSKLLIRIAFSTTVVTVFLILSTLPANAGMPNVEFTTRDGSVCKLSEGKAAGSTLKMLLDCRCMDAKKATIKYKCSYVADSNKCCSKLSKPSLTTYLNNWSPCHSCQAALSLHGKKIITGNNKLTQINSIMHAYVNHGLV
jgi:hypothetical protein